MNLTVGGTLNTNSFQEFSPSDIIIELGRDKGTILHVPHGNSVRLHNCTVGPVCDRCSMDSQGSYVASDGKHKTDQTVKMLRLILCTHMRCSLG